MNDIFRFKIAIQTIKNYKKTTIILSLLFMVIAVGYSAMFPLLVSTGSTLYKRGRGILATGLFIASNIGISIAPFVTRFISRNNLPMSLGISVILISIVFIIVIVVNTISVKKKMF